MIRNYPRVRILTAVCFISLLVIAGPGANNARGAVWSANYSEPINSDYQYRTERVIPPPRKKTFKDYIPSFLWWGKDKKVAPPAAESMALKARVRDLGKQLLANSREGIAGEYSLTINSFVNLNNLYKTSSLGRYISEELLGDLQLAGVDVLDVRKTAGIMVRKKSGEYGLSRDMKELSYVQNSQAMVVGTYTYADNQIFINARILRNNDGMVLSNASQAFELDPVTRQMLADEAAPRQKAALVRTRDFSSRINNK
jgi:TolB-like protein